MKHTGTDTWTEAGSDSRGEAGRGQQELAGLTQAGTDTDQGGVQKGGAAEPADVSAG